jgi:HD superfamily phosphodiesterase
MNTEEAKRLATERHKYLEGFIAEFKVEADGKYDRF